MTFAELGISEKYILHMEKLGITEPTAVQEKVIPQIAAGANVIFQSETGSGKTFAFLIPLLQKIENVQQQQGVEGGAATSKPQLVDGARIVIVSPTFELSSQLKQAAASVTELKTALFIGGAPLKRQIEMLKEKPAIVIGTPARLVELIRLKKLKVQNAAALIFDEADRLFSKEIAAETEALASCFGNGTQIIACSATISKKVQDFVERRSVQKPQGVASTSAAFTKIILPSENVLRDRMEHWAFFAERREKIDFLRSLLRALETKRGGQFTMPKTLVFTSRADQVENIAAKLQYKKINCSALHAKTKNQERQTMLQHFKSGKTPILITSDLASRGLDIPDIEYIVQTDLPSDEDFFVHRSGRTARAGKKGVNIVIGDEYELRNLAALEKKLKIKVTPKDLRGGKVCAI